jgi:tetratricopeptide (TPR) repeat protein
MAPSLNSVSRDSGADSVLMRLLDEIGDRVQAGESVDVEAYAQAHPEYAERLRQLLPAVRMMANLGRSAASGEASVPPSVSDEGPVAATLGDFRILREVGRGGMGVVYEAEQLSLGRRVALKVLPFAATMDPRHLERFHNEARAAACLHHEHIVPIYAVGQERGVHYYAMQFIDGLTLAQSLKPRPSALPCSDQPTTDQPTPSPERTAAETAVAEAETTAQLPRDRAEFRRIAEWGIQAAEALEHAHSLGIVHRDVKPGNLMLDGQGKLWVTDFGLARMGGDAGLTQTGDLVGTLRYMSPEQALAKRGVVDHRTDIYSLGATLYEVLALRPTFAGIDRQELLRQIAFEEPKAPRRVNRAIPTELETIVLKAMEKNPAERYATAQELADDLRRFLEDRPIQARRPTLWQRARKWAQRHKPLVGATAVVLLVVALLGGTAGLWWVQTRAAAEGEARVLLQQARRLGREEKWDEALSAARHAQGLLTGLGANAELRQDAEELVKDLSTVARLEQVRVEGAALRSLSDRYTATDRGYARAFADHGLDVAALDAKTVADGVRASAIRIHLLEALDDWAYVRDILHMGDGEPLRALAQLADDDPWRRRLRDPQVRHDRAALERLAQEEAALVQPAAVLRWLGLLLRAAGSPKAEVRLLRAAQQHRPGEYYTNSELAWRLVDDPARLGEAIGFLRAAVAIRPQNPFAHTHLGLALGANGQLDEAIAEHREAFRLGGNQVEFHNNLGLALERQGKLDEAIAAYREAIRLNKDYLEAHGNLGNALQGKGDVDGAIKQYREVLRLKKDDPLSHYNLGLALQAKGDLEGAFQAFKEAVHYKKDYPHAHYCLGLILYKKGDLEGAIKEYRKALRLRKDYADAHNNLGIALAEKGDLEGAFQAFKEALHYKKDYPHAHLCLGLTLYKKGDLEGAIKAYREALRLWKDYADAHHNLGIALAEKGDLDGAIKELQEVLRLQKENPTAHFNLGNVLGKKGDLEGAIKAYREALRLNKNYPAAYCNLGNVLASKGDLVSAIEAYREALRLQEDSPEAYCNLGRTLQAQGQFSEALSALKRGHQLGSKRPGWPYPSAQWVQECQHLVELDARLQEIQSGKKQPEDAERIALAEVCHLKRLYRQEARFYEEAFAEQPNRGSDETQVHRHNAARAAALASCGQGKDADHTDDKERRRLRQQALRWLQADLAAYQRLLEQEPDKARPVIAQRMEHWLKDTDFASVRGEALAKLPAAERQAWQQLWADIADLLARAKTQAGPEKKPGMK